MKLNEPIEALAYPASATSEFRSVAGVATVHGEFQHRR